MVYKPVLILAARTGAAKDFANRIYQKLANHKNGCWRKYLLKEINIDFHPDKEIKVEILENVREHECYFIHDSSLYPQDWKESLLQVNDALMISDAAVINNVLPYMCYSRQDRPTGRTPISAALLAENIKSSGAKRVLTTDLHNPAISGFYRGISFENLKLGYTVLIDYIKEKHGDFLKNAVVVPPDDGAARRTSGYGKRLNLSSVSIEKIRDGKTNEILEMKIIGDIKGKNALIVDDIVSTGGTLCDAAHILKENGANSIYAVATHGVLCKDKYGKSAKEKIEASPIEQLIITESIPRKDDGKIKIVSISDFIGEVIKRITHAESISELYEI